jgi:hypothetical protein
MKVTAASVILGFGRAHGDEAPILEIEGRRRGGGDAHQFVDLVVAQRRSRVIQADGRAAQE